MNFSMPELLIVLLIVAVIFGTKRLRSIGSDLGNAVRGFRKAMGEEEKQGLSSPDAVPGKEPSTAKPGDPAGDQAGGTTSSS